MTKKKAAALKPNSEMVTENILLGPDGVYRWTYEVPMLKNPTILITVYNVLGIAFGVVYLFTLLVSLIDGSVRSLAELWAQTWPFLILFGVFLVIGAIAYVIVAAMYGWKYVVDFEMTDTYIRHIQNASQSEKAKVIGAITVAVGLMAKQRGTVSAGRLGASKSVSTSEYSKVKTVKVRPRRHVIYVNHTLERNQIYAAPEDFGFVSRYILEHCENAKVK